MPCLVFIFYNQVWSVCSCDNSHVLKRRNAIKLSKELAENTGAPAFTVTVSFTSNETINFILKRRVKYVIRVFVRFSERKICTKKRMQGAF